MECKEEVHSDDGSFELINLDDYASESERLNREAVVSSSMDLSDDGSYDFLCSEVSETLVLSKEEAFNSITVFEHKPSEEMKSFSSEPAQGGMEFKRATDSDLAEQGDTGFKMIIDSDPTEGDVGFKSATDSDHTEEEGDMGFKSATDSDPTEVEIDMRFENETNYDSKVQQIPERINKVKKRNLMTMICQSSDYDLFDYPVHIKLKDDIREVAKNHIIRYLPAKSLAKCRRVSKEWNQWISSPFLAHMQSQYFRKTSGFFQSSKPVIRFFALENSAYGVPDPSLGFLPMDVSIKSSCNGLLLCQAVDDDNIYYICNPANEQWVRLPPSNYYHGAKPNIVLAFEPSSFNFEPCYQVVCPFSLPDPDMGPIVYFDIYDSKAQSWRISDAICVDLDESDVKSEGIFVDGNVYWETTGGVLLAFDLKNEIYGVQKLPLDEGGALSKVHGELCYVKAQYHHSMRLCMLVVYGGVTMSLKNTISFDVSVDGVEDGEFVECRVVANPRDDVLAVVVKASQGQERLYVYHVKDQILQGPWFISHSRKLFPYVNSLVSLFG